MIPCAKFGDYQPLNRQSDACARVGVALDVSTLTDRVACAGFADLYDAQRRPAPVSRRKFFVLAGVRQGAARARSRALGRKNWPLECDPFNLKHSLSF